MFLFVKNEKKYSYIPTRYTSTYYTYNVRKYKNYLQMMHKIINSLFWGRELMDWGSGMRGSYYNEVIVIEVQ